MARMKSSANPIRRVVTMLQTMQKKVEAEAKKAEELYEKFMCYCTTTEGQLSAAIEDAETRIPQLESSIKETTEMHAKLGQELTQHKADRADAEDEIAQAMAIREKENKEFMAESGTAQANIDALGKAIPAIEKGLGGSFLQSSEAAQLRRLSLTQELSVADRDALSAFLSSSSSDEDSSPGSAEILGMLKQMKEEMEKDLAEVSGTENTAKMDHESLVAAKKSEIAAHTAAIEEKLAREGEAAIEIATMKHDLEDTKEDLAADTKFIADIKKQCEAKTKEMEAQRKSRKGELIAIADTIKMLNSDDALELFKKAIPSASAFLQVEVTSGELRARAMQMLRESRGKHRSQAQSVQLDLVLLAMHGKKAGFEKVITLIDEMVALLGKEQVEDDNKKSYCESELDKAEDQKKIHEHDVSDIGKAIDESNSLLKALGEEMDTLKTSIQDLDVSVQKATNQRKEEHEEFTVALAANNAAKQLIGMAKKRMEKFYNPKALFLNQEQLRKIAPDWTTEATSHKDRSDDDDDDQDQESLLQLHRSKTRLHTKSRRSFDDESDSDGDFAPPPQPPKANIAFQQKQESAGVLAMMDGLIADIDKEILAMELEEKDAQEDYEGTMKDASEKRAADSKALTEKETTKAELDAELQEHMGLNKAAMTELGAVNQYIATLHGECDWLLEEYKTRKEARANEIDAMKKAKAVLSGAAFDQEPSLIQVTRHLKLRHA